MSQVTYQRKKRSKYEIVHDILDQCQNGAKKTWIMYRANLSYDLTTNYLNDLVKRGLVENREGLFYITDKGKQLLGVLKAWKEKKAGVEELVKKIRELYPEPEEEGEKAQAEPQAPVQSQS